MKSAFKIAILLVVLYLLYMAYKKFFGSKTDDNSSAIKDIEAQKAIIKSSQNKPLGQSPSTNVSPSAINSSNYVDVFTYANNPWWFPTSNPLVNVEYRLAEEGQI